MKTIEKFWLSFKVYLPETIMCILFLLSVSLSFSAYIKSRQNERSIVELQKEVVDVQKSVITSMNKVNDHLSALESHLVFLEEWSKQQYHFFYGNPQK